MDLRRLRYFVAVAEEGGLHRAAERLNVSQSALSRRIRELEIEIGQDLFERLPTGVRLKPPGLILLDYARSILGSVADAEDHLDRHAAGRGGQLRVGMTAMSGQIGFIARSVVRFHRECSETGLRLKLAGSTPALVEMLQRGVIDTAILYQAEVPDLESRTLRHFGALLALPRGHGLTRKRKVLMAELRGETILVFPRDIDHAAYDAIIAACVVAGMDSSMFQEIPSEEVRLALVSAGMGIAIVNDSILERSHAPELAFRAIDGVVAPRTLDIAWLRGAAAPAVKRLVDIVLVESRLPRLAKARVK